MHELAMASAMQQRILQAAAEHGARRVLSVQIQIGELSLLNPEQVEFWLTELTRDTVAEGAKFVIQIEKARIRCAHCGYRGAMPVEEDPLSHFHLPALTCPDCASTEVHLEQGREVLIRSVEVLTEGPSTAGPHRHPFNT
jgi:hydrogenase nickel incorporation protein HypA/HybF